MLAEVLLDTAIHVHYRFLSLAPANDDRGNVEEAARGQVNGLCQAAVPGRLHMITGLHTGNVQVRVELHDGEPELGDEWEDAVETLFATTSDDLWLTAFDSGEGPVDLPPGMYRVRYCARGYEAAHDLDTLLDDEPVDHYLLQFWPLAGADRILRTSGPAATYWHTEGPEPVPDADALRVRVRAVRERRAAREDEDEDDVWGGDEPDDPRVIESADGTASLWQLDQELVLALAAADPARRREVSAWVVERLLQDSGLAGEPWVPKALAGLRQGTALPPRDLVDRSLPPMLFGPGTMPYGNGVLPPDDIAVPGPWSSPAFPAAGIVGPDDLFGIASRGESEASWPGEVYRNNAVRVSPEGIERHRAVAAMYDAAGLDTLAAVCATIAVAAFEAPEPADFLDQVRAEFPDLIS